MLFNPELAEPPWSAPRTVPRAPDNDNSFLLAQHGASSTSVAGCYENGGDVAFLRMCLAIGCVGLHPPAATGTDELPLGVFLLGRFVLTVLTLPVPRQ